MPTYTFDEIKRSQTFKLKCGCGKRFQRTISEFQTVSPWNKNTDGTVKNRGEVWDSVGQELREAVDKFKPICPGCDSDGNVEIVSQFGEAPRSAA